MVSIYSLAPNEAVGHDGGGQLLQVSCDAERHTKLSQSNHLIMFSFPKPTLSVEGGVTMFVKIQAVR